MLQLLGEPPRTPYDLSFSIANIPVRVSPMFWVAVVLLGVGGARGEDGGRIMVLFVIGAFVSILVHELGHALLMRRFGETPRIVLLMSGGLAISDRPSYLPDDALTRSTREQILISLAGPAAGFLLAAIIAGLSWLAGAQFTFRVPLTVYVDFTHLTDSAGSNLQGLRVLSTAANVLLWINIYWGVMNLAPIYPLDGGQVARELFTLRDPWKGVVRSLWLSIIVAAMISVLGLVFNSFFIAILFGVLAFSNYQTLQRFQGRGLGGNYDDGYGQKPW